MEHGAWGKESIVFTKSSFHQKTSPTPIVVRGIDPIRQKEIPPHPPKIQHSLAALVRRADEVLPVLMHTRFLLLCLNRSFVHILF